MMTKTTIRSLFYSICMALTMAILFAACKGEVGPKGDTGATGVGTAGPTGATGPAGASGVAGATGPAGVSGVSGTSSVTQVTYATSFTLAATNASFNLVLPNYITKAVIDRSLVMVYLQSSPILGSQVYQIPGSVGGVYGDTFGYAIFNINSTTLAVGVYRTASAGVPLEVITLARVLIIPAATVVNGRKAAVDYSNYEAVKAYYDLK